jgi:NAD+ kinase
MLTHFHRIGVIGKFGDPVIAPTLTDLYHFLKQRGHEIWLDSQSADFLLTPTINGLHIDRMLHASIFRDNTEIHRQTAVNEVVVHRWVTPSMIEIVTSINGVYLNSQRSDGLIVATPTGSTAYSLSAGGPILHPGLSALVLVPLNPHTLSNRPLVIDDNVEISIGFGQTRQINALVTCDHLEIPDVLIGDKIVIKKADKMIKILHPEDHDYFHILRSKLNWSVG